MEAKEKDVFNLNFPGNAEGIEGFEQAVRVLELIKQGSTDASQLPPLVSIPTAVRRTTKQRNNTPRAPLTPLCLCRNCLNCSKMLAMQHSRPRRRHPRAQSMLERSSLPYRRLTCLLQLPQAPLARSQQPMGLLTPATRLRLRASHPLQR